MSAGRTETSSVPCEGAESPDGAHTGEVKGVVIETTPPPSQESAEEGSGAESIPGGCPEADAVIRDLSKQHLQLQEQAKMAISSMKMLLDQKELGLMACYKAAYEHKLGIINDYKEKVMSSSAAKKPPFPSLLGGAHCGFMPEMTNLVHGTASLVLEHRREVQVGDETRVSVIGSLGKEGKFWVRIMPDDVGLQDVMLLNLSNTIGVELAMSTLGSLDSASVGDLCCALYSEDQRWYRARVIEVLKGQRAKVYFLDYGNIETISYSNLTKLHPKFLVYPFQMIQCCLTTDLSLTFIREAKWKFTDLTHGSELKVKILRCLPDTIHDKVHLVELTNLSKSEPFDVGKIILMMAEMEPQQPNPIKYRDIRYPASGKSGSTSVTIIQSQGTHTSEATPTTTIETPPSNKSKSEELLVASSSPPTNQLPLSPDSGLPSQSPSSVMQSVSNISCSSFSSSTVASTSSHDIQDSHTPSTEVGERGVASSKGVRHLPSSDDTGGAESPTGNDVIASAAQIKITNSAETAVNSHSAIPAAQSDSHSPIPMSGTKNQPVNIITETKALPCDPPTSEASQLDLKPGTMVDVYVTTPLSSDGSFWVQLASAEEPEFLELIQRLQKQCCEEPPTPVFFSPGDICAAQFSEDSCWYRAKVEGIVENQFLVRYLDFGNSENRAQHLLVALRSEFRNIPFKAFCCSIADNDHTSFSEKEIARFEELTETKKLTAKIVTEEDRLFGVVLLLSLPSGMVDLNEEVYTADVKINESISFTLTNKEEEERGKKGAVSEAAPSIVKDGVPLQPSWADFMDDLQSPQNDGIFTLAGQDSRDHTPVPPHSSPSPRRSSPAPHRSSPAPRQLSPAPLQSSPAPYRSSPSPQQHRSTPPPASSHTPGSQDGSQERGVAKSMSKTLTSNGSQGRAPRINQGVLGMVRKSLAEKSWERKDRVKSEQPQGAPKVCPDPLTSSTPPPGLPQPKGIHSINQVSRNGTSFPPTGRRRKSPEPDSSQVKLFVRYMPHNKSMEDVFHLFALYGHIHTLEYHTEHKDKLYLIMDREGGLKAIEGLNGSHLSGSPKALMVQPYKVSASVSPEQADLDNLPSTTCTRLFVKNIPLNRSMEEVKGMFSQFGKVIGVVPVPSRKNVVYMYMDPEGAQVAIDQLYGKAVAKHSKPLIVEVSQTPRKNR